jgi:hypothetical protein
MATMKRYSGCVDAWMNPIPGRDVVLQQSRVDWLREGDRNTKFFHRRAIRRVKKNTIKVLRNRNDEITKDRREMEGLARDYFINLYEAD